MIIGIDPKVDYVFKRLFGREQNAPLLIHLLNAILQFQPGSRIASLQILNPFHDKENLDDKLSVLDIKARDESGRLFNIEMQMLAYGPFRTRVLYYWAKLYQGQMLEGMQYEELHPAISICFVNTPLYPEVPAHHLVFELRERRHAMVFTDHLQVHILELAKFKLRGDQLAAPEDPWLYFLCHGDELDTEALPAALELPEIHKALGEMKMLTKDQLELERYESRLKMKRDMYAALKEAQTQGLTEGLTEGRAEGRAEGQKEGKIERIHGWQRFLRQQPTPAEQLMIRSIEELEAMAQSLERDAANLRVGL